MAGDGSSLDASLEVASVWDGVPVTPDEPASTPLLHLEWASGEDDAASPCDVLQVRYLGSEGWHVVAGYFWPDFARLPSSVVDLQPLIVSTEQSSGPPEADDVTPCDTERGVRGGTTLGNEVRATPAEALLAFLATPEADGYVDSWYHEHIADGGERYVYTYSPDYTHR